MEVVERDSKMNHKFFIIVFFFFVTTLVYGQSLEVDFRGKGNGDEVKLLWIPKQWSPEVDGFNIKRKAENGTWEKLNSGLIVPSTTLRYVSNDQGTISRLNLKRDSLINENKLRDLDYETMKKDFLMDENGIKFMGFTVVYDYDYSLIHGFGYYDRNIPKSKEYTYGLFPVKNGNEEKEPIGTFKWAYGESKNHDLAPTHNFQKISRKKGLKVIWTISTQQSQEDNIKAFHILKEDTLGALTQLTDVPLRLNTALEEAPVFFVDEHYNTEERATFYLQPIDIFDYKLNRLKAIYNPEDVALLRPPNLDKIEDNGSTAVTIQWSFSEVNEKKISEFEILRRRKITDTPQLIASVNPGVRSYTDSIFESGYYFYSVKAQTSNGTVLPGNESMIFKQVSFKPQKPQGLKAEVTTQGGDDYIFLRWKPKSASDTVTRGYYLYTDAVMSDGLAKEGSLGVVESNNYKFQIDDQKYGKRYRFAVTSVNYLNEESEMSDTLEVLVPSKELPAIDIWPVSKENQTVTLNWQYPDFIEDLRGFRLYENGQLIAGPSVLPAGARKWISPELQEGRYTYQIEAVTSSGVISKKSVSRKFNIISN